MSLGRPAVPLEDRGRYRLRLVVIFGPAAVGKMAVGMELERLTGLRLFHNHMSVDVALHFFPFGTPGFSRLVSTIRTAVFEEVAGSDLPGLIFTYVWALEDPRDKAIVDRLARIFTDRGASVSYAELTATQEERLRRNETPLRLAEKYPKRDLARSRALLLEHDARHRLNSDGDFFYPDQHIKIDNTHLAPGRVAEQIIAAFAIPRAPAAGLRS
jgi:hypothetical protein